MAVGTTASPTTRGKIRISDIRDFISNDMPYTAQIDIEIPEGSGNFFPKTGVDGKNRNASGAFIPGRSSMFPENWDLDKIAEEAAYVRSRINAASPQNNSAYFGPNSSGTFNIQMYITDPNDYKSVINSTFPEIR